MTQNQYSDTFWVQNEFIVHKLIPPMGFCKIWQKSVVITVKNREKYRKKHISYKQQKSGVNHKLLTSSE